VLSAADDTPIPYSRKRGPAHAGFARTRLEFTVILSAAKDPGLISANHSPICS
jgi:hypothetical protein